MAHLPRVKQNRVANAVAVADSCVPEQHNSIGLTSILFEAVIFVHDETMIGIYICYLVGNLSYLNYQLLVIVTVMSILIMNS